MHNGTLEYTPIVGEIMPQAMKKVIHLIEPDEFERLLPRQIIANRDEGRTSSSSVTLLACDMTELGQEERDAPRAFSDGGLHNHPTVLTNHLCNHEHR
ncbi:MAG TPA: hypothetical protein VFB12_20550 [Ktedonobacteraceae bacterium]|nr:hypothetical protein [Ktedonobacteraceae bacterium]